MSAAVQTIVLGGGCFWCIEAVMQRLRGVTSVTSGYAGGSQKNPTYETVSHGSTGHTEVVKVQFDPNTISLDVILSAFFALHDPTQLNRQGNDVGEQYRSIVLYTVDKQKQIIESFIQQLIDTNVYSDPIVTEVQPLDVFYLAEEHHQNFYNNNRSQGYCQAIIDPKIAKLRKQFAQYLVE